MRIVSLAPAATEIVADLGLLGCLVGRSHECRWPAEVHAVPAVSAARIDPAALDSQQIDGAVREAVATGRPLFTVDGAALSALRPEVIVAQDLCRVCAADAEDVASVAVRVIALGPRTLAEVAESVRLLGRELGVASRGEAVAADMLARIDRVRRLAAGLRRRRVFVAEWTDPPFACGHWIPEMVEAAGGEEVMGRAGERSVPVAWEDVRAAGPELVIAAPCGFDEERAARAAGSIPLPCPVVAVDADRFFVKPAPSLARGVEILARILHGIDATAS